MKEVKVMKVLEALENSAAYAETDMVYKKDYDTLKSQNERLLKCIQFYADISKQSEFVCLNGARDSDYGGVSLDDFEIIEISKRESYSAKHYGKLARQTLADLGIKGGAEVKP